MKRLLLYMRRYWRRYLFGIVCTLATATLAMMIPLFMRDAIDAMAVTNHRRKRAGYAQIEFGLGLHLGEVTHANVGAPGRLAFNVVGPAVNKTARIQSLTKEARVPLLLSAEFAALLKRPLRSLGRRDLRGVAGAHEVFTLMEERQR